MNIYNIISFFGIFILIGFAWVCSADKRNMNWKVIGWGLVIQISIALFIFVVPAGAKFFLFLNEVVIKILDSAGAGARFVFGRLAIAPGEMNEFGEKSLGFMLAFQAFPTIIFFSALISLLYFMRIMPLVIKAFANVFTRLMKISGAESLATASNIFVGVESAITIKPYLNDMTRSEFCTILTAGMATVASNILVLYVFTLKSVFPTIAGHLISASLLSAPAALIMSKIILPEKGVPKTLGVNVKIHYEREKSVFEAIINAANSGVKMIVGITALLIAILGLVALADLLLSMVGPKINMFFHINLNWSLKGLLGYIFYPFTLILGIPKVDAGAISGIIAERMIVTEVVAYKDLAVLMSKGVLNHARSAVIATYALCGFAHVASMAIFVGGVSALVPGRTSTIASVAFRALLAATLACLLTACVAGTFFTEGSILFSN